jgi:hypothetical protein
VSYGYAGNGARRRWAKGELNANTVGGGQVEVQATSQY